MSALKRILNKDMKSIQEQNLKNLGIYIEFNEEDIVRSVLTKFIVTKLAKLDTI